MLPPPPHNPAATNVPQYKNVVKIQKGKICDEYNGKNIPTVQNTKSIIILFHFWSVTFCCKDLTEEMRVASIENRLQKDGRLKNITSATHTDKPLVGKTFFCLASASCGLARC